MPFKPIDLQLSIPRTPELSSHQGQQNVRPIVEQTRLEEVQIKQTELARGKNADVEHTTGLNIRQDQDSQNGGDGQKRKRQPDQHNVSDEEKPPAHPYKGHHVDISL
ncbi:hypothetical protein [Paenibacillus sp. NEAU-GSW1]|uniref:hypothetical protein n=1 Tax=Paenibacillus sp. NEAU-GSW1 TaxID=2682486 RepID=UPI0012E1278E|nr:hypothetical protein [Paenibacillus sp. NEAU-GSW1]MUT66381.1 hypothetical protein [Paenibacillus sp. NEAU-GSW1]